MQKNANGDSFTVLRDSSPVRGDALGPKKKGCFASLCSCLSKPDLAKSEENVTDDYGPNRARPHLIAEVGLNPSTPASRKPSAQPFDVGNGNDGKNGTKYHEDAQNGQRHTAPAEQWDSKGHFSEGESAKPLFDTGTRASGRPATPRLSDSQSFQPKILPLVPSEGSGRRDSQEISVLDRLTRPESPAHLATTQESTQDLAGVNRRAQTTPRVTHLESGFALPPVPFVFRKGVGVMIWWAQEECNVCALARSMFVRSREISFAYKHRQCLHRLVGGANTAR